MLRGSQGPSQTRESQTRRDINMYVHGPCSETNKETFSSLLHTKVQHLHNHLRYDIELVNELELADLDRAQLPALDQTLGDLFNWWGPPAPSLPPENTAEFPEELLHLHEPLSRFPRTIAARGAPPLLDPLLRYMHVPTAEHQATKERLFRLFLIDLIDIQKQFLQLTTAYAMKHDLPPPRTKYNPPTRGPTTTADTPHPTYTTHETSQHPT